MKRLINYIIVFLLLTINTFASEKIETGKTFLKSITNKSLTKKETISFLNKFAVIIEDERGDGEVTYVFDSENYTRYKGIEVISTDAWRFSNLGALRLFNKDIKMTWKIKISDKENLINIKTKFEPVGKLYKFSVMDKSEFLNQIEEAKLAERKKQEAAKQAEIEKKKKQEQEKLEAEQKLAEEKKKLEEERLAVEQKLEEEKKKLEEERLAAEQKLEEEKRKLEEEKLALQKELEELKKKKAEELERSKKTPAQLKKEERDKKKKEKLAAQKKAKEEKERLKQEKLAAQKKAKEEKERLKQEKLAAQKKANEENKKNIKKDCKKYWDQCKDTDEFVQKYYLVSKIRKECKERAIKVAKYGKPKLPFIAFKNYEVNGMFYVKEDGTEFKRGELMNYKGEKKWIEDTNLNRGIFKLTEIGQYQNVMGVSWDHHLTCVYNLKKNKISNFHSESAH